MRIIAGEARGVRLAAPERRDVRPTLDRVREAFFSIVGPGLAGARFLDLYAGTGANGLEALSRGAAHAGFVESDPASRKLITENIARTKLGDRARVHAVSLPDGLSRLIHESPFHFIYADPPHRFTDYAALFDAIDAIGLLAAGGVVVLEHATRTPVPESIGAYERVRTAAYGETTLSFFHPRKRVAVPQSAA